ncbi:hypothetical protein NDU88_001976 [Pleurodeles waltl]|uniref:Uncharacterized protein n=1 Tax=Pleurodeles waltl TaxID=8319 RepID=A0AAV7TLQ0_PLEWA|nr:hypothetical protein NDU88_001976 [Pleurodeles waltl]
MSVSGSQASRVEGERQSVTLEAGACNDGACWSRAALEVRKVRRLTSRDTLRLMSGGSGSTSEVMPTSPREQPVFHPVVVAPP